MPVPTIPTAEDEVVGICRDLIRIDSSNYGDGTGPGERAAAEYVAAKLAEVGFEPTVLESEDKRTSVIVRWEGEDPSRDGLLSTATSTSSRPRRATGPTTPSRGRSPTTASGGGAQSTRRTWTR